MRSASPWALVLVACLLGAGVALGAATPLVRTAHNASLKATVLVDRHGKTLYDLSVERHGRFVCDTRLCLGFWTPLTVAKGVKPAGAVPLGTVRRPDGSIQVTYEGAPLYTFNEDSKRGDVRGEGFKDVGVWHAAALGKAHPAPSGSGGGYTYP